MRLNTKPHVFVFPALLLLLLGAFVWQSQPAVDAQRLPNIVLIFIDDMGYGDLGTYGAQGFQTPNLDRMAAEGIRFTDFYVAQAVCSASRAALLTGCYPNRIGIQGALNHQANYGINADEMTLAEVLKQRGYATAIFGKWHLGHHPQFLPVHHGFDEYLGLPYSNDMWPKHPQQKNFYPDLPLIEGDKVIQLDPDQSQLTTLYTERAVKFIEQSKNQPFFLYLPHTMPHVPLFVSNKYKGKSKQGLYGDVIEEIDWSAGQVLDTLKRLKLDEQTLVIFTSDNGPWMSYGNHAGSPGPFRESKGTAFEGGVRVPFIARWPGHIPKGAVSQLPAMTIDLLPTLANLIKAPLPKHKLDGLDIWPLLTNQRGARSPHEVYYFYWGKELHALRSGQWKLHLPHPYQSLEFADNDGKPGKYVRKELELSLFDLAQDPGEMTNVAARQPAVVQRLLNYAEQARADLGDALTKREGSGVRPAGQLGK
jgi:arylsulfatase A-like enzyme